MRTKRCPSCGAVHDIEVLTCDCGVRLNDIPPIDSEAPKRIRGSNLSGPFRSFALAVASILSILGILAALVSVVYSLYVGNWLNGLLLSPLAAIYSLAMFYVFRHAADNRTPDSQP